MNNAKKNVKDAENISLHLSPGLLKLRLSEVGCKNTYCVTYRKIIDTETQNTQINALG